MITIKKLRFKYADESSSDWMPSEIIRTCKIKAIRFKVQMNAKGELGMFKIAEYTNLEINGDKPDKIGEIAYIEMEYEDGSLDEVYPRWPYAYWDKRNNGTNMYQRVIQFEDEKTNEKRTSIWIVAGA